MVQQMDLIHANEEFLHMVRVALSPRIVQVPPVHVHVVMTRALYLVAIACLSFYYNMYMYVYMYKYYTVICSF